MAVSAVVLIEHFSTLPSSFDLKEGDFTGFSSFDLKEDDLAPTVEYNFTHLSHLSTPVARNGLENFETEDPDNWLDGPEKQPFLLYRHRFAWGRDRLELFDTGYGLALTSGSPGAKWGSLDNYSGLIVYQELAGISATGEVRQFLPSNYGLLREHDSTVSNEAMMSHLGEISGDTTLELFPFLIIAEPEPNSIKNPVDTDVFIRLSNFSTILASGTITLYLDGVLQDDLKVEEFVGGLGGFDVTWENDFLFDYDSRVVVRWEFSDTDVPANSYVISYPFYTVSDFAGPRVQNLIPDNGSTDIAINTFIQFDLVDFENNVDLSSLRLYVNNVLVVAGETGTLEFFELTAENGYTVKYTPNDQWLYGDLIPVALFIKDTSIHKNETFFVYSFTTAESTPPRLVNPTPEPCSIDVPTSTDVIVELVDGGHGIDKDTVSLITDEVDQEELVTVEPIIRREE